MKNRLIFLGPPGAGKGTQAQRICDSNGLMHLSTGDLLRAEVESNTALGKQAADLMGRGELVGDELVLAIVETRLKKNNFGWLLDGFPRTIPQARALELLLDQINQPIKRAVLLELDDAVLIERLMARGRSHDNEKTIKHRLEVYREKTAPLINYYSEQKLLVSIEASGSIESISQRIQAALS